MVSHDKTFFLFKGCVIFRFIYGATFFNPFIHCWTFRFFHIMAVVSNAVMDIGNNMSQDLLSILWIFIQQ